MTSSAGPRTPMNYLSEGANRALHESGPSTATATKTRVERGLQVHHRPPVVPMLVPVMAIAMLCLPLAACSVESSSNGDTTTCTTAPGPGQAIGCHAPTTPDGGGPTVHVTVKNFHIMVPSIIPTGRVTFVVYGQGATLHEFNVARSSLAPRDLPIAQDDRVDDSHNTSSFTWLGQVEDIDIGVTASLTVTIIPGHYDFYCNMDGHYMAGMSAQATAL